ncbi:MAG: DNA gyrase subunit B [Planctomycetia bacterium]|nr:DNA gyrase subunit B [Planctomycetia bacterium]
MSEQATNEAELTDDDRRHRQASDDYTSDNIKVLRDADHIRERPGMYIGDTGSHGLHHLVYELVYNSADEALAGYCTNIVVKIHVDESCSVSDDGRGIPVDMHPDEGRPVLEVVMTKVGAGGKFDKNAYKISLGLHGMGAKAVTALSEWTEAQVQRGGRTYRQEYARGKPTTDVKDIGASKRSGTTIHFRPDPTIFHDAKFMFDTLESRLRELAYLNKGLCLRLFDERSGKDETYKFDGGISQYVQYLASDEKPLHATPIYVDRWMPGLKEGQQIRIEVAMQYTDADDERTRSYTNSGFNPMGGTHLSGFRGALTRTMGAYGQKNELFKSVVPIGEDYRKGLTAIVSIQHPEPLFNSQTKEKLNNEEVEGAVSAALSEALARYLEENPKEAKRIMAKVITEAEAREAAAKAKKALKDRKGLLSGGGLPGKLYDCSTRDREESELFLVEGDSAGGSAVSGRDNKYQAILPLRGKPLNVEKARMENMLKNEEITNLIAAIGIDIGLKADEADEESETVEAKKKVRYGKIIIMTDADVDGQHIRTLLLTFFYRQMPLLIKEGRIYIARPPLYKITEKKNIRFVQTADEMHRELVSRGFKNTRLAIYPRGGGDVRRLEGDELLALVNLMSSLDGHLVTLERRGINLTTFLPRVTERGLPIYRVVVAGREEWCHTAEEVDALRQQEAQRLGRDLVVEEGLTSTEGVGPTPAIDTFFEQELHEVKKINESLRELAKFGLDQADLIPAIRVAGREPPPRLKLESGETAKTLLHLRDLTGEVKRLGERGLSVMRFKGLGEMDAEELWNTTLDPERRTVMRVRMDDAIKADEMFRTLMGEKVEPRRDFIYKYAIEVKDIDLHGA